jgi:brassinosteroid-6-oxidase 1
MYYEFIRNAIVLINFLLFLCSFFPCRWEEAGKNEIMKFPRVEAPNGLHIKVWEN